MTDKNDEAPRLHRTQLSRRDFVVAAGAGAALIAPPAVAFEASRAGVQGTWDHSADVVVVGTGAAGCAAALFAADAGVRVLMLEKRDSFGGTTFLSGGIFYIPNNPHMQAAGIADNRPDCLRYLARTAYPSKYSPDAPRFGLTANEFALLEVFYDEGASIIAKLAKMDALQSVPWLDWEKNAFPDYYSDLTENKAPRGRSLAPKIATTVEPVAKGGAALIGQLKAALAARGIVPMMGHRVQRLVLSRSGQVVGVEAMVDKQLVSVRAERGVVFGSGGFIHNPELRSQLRGPVYSGCGPLTNEGDFVKIGGAAGAQLGNMSNAWWYPQILEFALMTTATGLSGANPGDGMIMVNKYGRRVVNEKAVYHDRNQVHFAWDPTKHEYPNSILFMVFDERTRQVFAQRNPIPTRGTAPKWLISGPTLEALGQAIDHRLGELKDRLDVRLDGQWAATMQQTIARFNSFAETGVDADFGRGMAAHEIAYQGARAEDNDKPNSTMYPLGEGPYYAVMICAGALDTNGGPRINAKSQVVDWRDQPIVGLYGAGNCIASPAGQAYWGGGATLGLALVNGAVAGRNAAAEPKKPA